MWLRVPCWLASRADVIWCIWWFRLWVLNELKLDGSWAFLLAGPGHNLFTRLARKGEGRVGDLGAHTRCSVKWPRRVGRARARHRVLAAAHQHACSVQGSRDKKEGQELRKETRVKNTRGGWWRRACVRRGAVARQPCEFNSIPLSLNSEKFLSAATLNWNNWTVAASAGAGLQVYRRDPDADDGESATTSM